MRISSRRGTIAFFIILGACLVALAVALNVGWIILNWRKVAPLVLGVIFFGVIIAGLIVNTIFLVHEIRRNEQHDSFINAVTHELKTPIASIRLYLETLQARDVDEAQKRQFYRIMQEDTDRLRTTIEQVLKAGELGHKRGADHRVSLDLAALVRDCLDVARTSHHLAPEALRFSSVSANGHMPTVTADPEELRTAIGNVLDNAIKYSGADVRVKVEVLTPDDKSVAVRVSDSGVGIARSELAQIFKRFYRVRARNVQQQIKGTGLGLFLVRSIARKHGGDAYAESEGEGRGATITITLPRSAA